MVRETCLGLADFGVNFGADFPRICLLVQHREITHIICRGLFSGSFRESYCGQVFVEVFVEVFVTVFVDK